MFVNYDISLPGHIILGILSKFKFYVYKLSPPNLIAHRLKMKLLFLLTVLVTIVYASPVHINKDDDNNNSATYAPKESFVLNLILYCCLVLLGGLFAGLTLGLMGQDEVYLKVLSQSGTPEERKSSSKVLGLLSKGKHWVLVTLLLGNVITNETLPIVLDGCLGGGIVAIITSTVLIVIFGEIIPQSVCVRYGLKIGAILAPFVTVVMYLMYPVAYPTALFLDWALGEQHGTMYKKAGLKTLVTLHQSNQLNACERLNNDEVTIISAVLDLKEKKVREVMTPVDDVFTMSSDEILDEKTVDEIFNAGFSRIPIHLPDEPTNFVGMLLVRVLIRYDPDDCLPVSSFPLATLPETNPETSCLNILNYFQEGKSHMVVVSSTPGEPVGALGVLTLEDVIEELIGEEIIDESDVYIDVHKAIKRKIPGPLSVKKHINQYLHAVGESPRHSTAVDRHMDDFSVTGNVIPSNLASNPIQTNNSFVKIKKSPHIALNSSPRLSVQNRNLKNDDSVPDNYDDVPLLRDFENEQKNTSINAENPALDSNNILKESPSLEHPATITPQNEIYEENSNYHTIPNITRLITELSSTQMIYNDINNDDNDDNDYDQSIGKTLVTTNSRSNSMSRSESRRNSRSYSRYNNKNVENEVSEESGDDENGDDDSNYVSSGGIIESVVNVKGYNKIIIENAISDTSSVSSYDSSEADDYTSSITNNSEDERENDGEAKFIFPLKPKIRKGSRDHGHRRRKHGLRSSFKTSTSHVASRSNSYDSRRGSGTILNGVRNFLRGNKEDNEEIEFTRLA